MIRTLLVIALSLAWSGCKNKESTGGDKPASADKAADKPAPAAKLVVKKLGGQPLEAEVPDDASIDDSTETAGFPAVTIYAAPTTFVFGAGEGSDVKLTLEESKTQLAKDPNKLKAFAREDKTADGWILTFTRDALAEPGKVLQGVSVRRNLAGIAWDCGTNADTLAEIAKAEKICLSLRAAK